MGLGRAHWDVAFTLFDRPHLKSQILKNKLWGNFFEGVWNPSPPPAPTQPVEPLIVKQTPTIHDGDK